MTSAFALRYSRALADVVLAPGSGVSPEQAIAQLRSFASTISSSPELLGALLNPSVQAKRKRAVISRLSEGLEVSRIITNFLFVVVDHRRVHILGEMAEGLEAIFDEHFGFARAEITTARDLDPGQAGALEAQLGQLSGKRIRPHYSVDTSLLGGAVARIGSTVYDGSVRGQFEQLRRVLVGDSAAFEERL
jgi:F-type H+-transporting ATPase subunit delta